MVQVIAMGDDFNAKKCSKSLHNNVRNLSLGVKNEFYETLDYINIF